MEKERNPKLITVFKSGIFFILFTAYAGGVGLMSSLYDQNNYRDLGQVNTFSLYASYAIASLFSERLTSM